MSHRPSAVRGSSESRRPGPLELSCSRRSRRSHLRFDPKVIHDRHRFPLHRLRDPWLGRRALNVAMFVSVGAIVFRRWGSVVGAGLAGAAPSTAIELIQISVPGRYTTLGDVVWNAIGAVAGAGIWIFMARCSRRRPRRATLVAARSTESSGAASWPPVGSWNRAPAGPVRPRPRRPDHRSTSSRTIGNVSSRDAPGSTSPVIAANRSRVMARS